MITDAMVVMALTRLMEDTGLPLVDAHKTAQQWMADHPAKTVAAEDARLEAAAAACFETYWVTIHGDDTMRWPDDLSSTAVENFRRIAMATIEAYGQGKEHHD